MWDEELAALVAQARDELPHRLTAFELLAKHQFGAIHNLAYGIVRDRDLAGGIAQDALLRIMAALPRLESIDKYPGWSRRITVNLAKSRLSKEKREREKRAAYELESSPDQVVESTTESFASLLEGLNTEERTIVALKILDDLEFSEISEITGLGVSATKMRYYRALDKIKGQQLSNY